MSQADDGFQAALAEARKGFEEGGIPIGACLVDKNGKILGRGHNMRVQKGSTILHVGMMTPFHSYSVTAQDLPSKYAHLQLTRPRLRVRCPPWKVQVVSQLLHTKAVSGIFPSHKLFCGMLIRDSDHVHNLISVFHVYWCLSPLRRSSRSPWRE